MDRLELLHHWLAPILRRRPTHSARQAGTEEHIAYTLAPASSDASFRRYFRVSFPDGSPSLIVMDAPPDKEDCRPFERVAGLFREAGLNVPAIHAANLEAGFLLLADLGQRTYLSALTDGSADMLYRDAIEALVRLQSASRAGELPEYDRIVLERELALFPDWYISRQIGHSLAAEDRAALLAVFERVLANNLAQARVYVHRDYHSRNLMVCTPNPGVLDFQDALFGPITYDLVSLLRDAYIDWPEEQVLDWTIRYWEAARRARLPVQSDFGEFYRDFEWMGVQRQLKVVGIFARLAHRDGKHAYLADQPRVLGYLHRTCRRYHQLDGLCRLLDMLAGSVRRAGHSF